MEGTSREMPCYHLFLVLLASFSPNCFACFIGVGSSCVTPHSSFISLPFPTITKICFGADDFDEGSNFCMRDDIAGEAKQGAEAASGGERSDDCG